MKKIAILFLILSLATSAMAQEKSIRAYLSYAAFAVPDDLAFIETYLAIEGSSVVFKEIEKGSFQATIDVTIIFTSNDTIRDFAKYELNSPVVNDLNRTNFGIIDQQRFSLPNGNYTMEVLLADQNNPEVPAFSTTEMITLDFKQDEVQLSAIQLIEGFEKSQKNSIITKNDFDLLPLVYAFYPESAQKLSFYTEIYNTSIALGSEGKFMVNYFIESFENLRRMQDFFFRRRFDAQKVNVVLASLDITQLPSGNYNLVVEVRDAANKLITENRVFFQRSNPSVRFNLGDIASVSIGNTFVSNYTHADTLRDYLLSLAAISTEVERDYAFGLAKTADILTMQRYFFNFWQNRNIDNPEGEWLAYQQEVKKVNHTFSTLIKKGYATDRGRVYLKYGPPDQMVKNYSEPSAYPYEIWHYYTLGRQRNKRFVFVTKDIVTNDFVQVHSDAIGELSNYRWQYDIYKRTWDPYSIDQSDPGGDVFGRRAYDFYTNPR